MLSKKVTMPLIGICIIGLIFGSYKVGTMTSTDAGVVSQKSSTEQSSPPIQSKEPTPTPPTTSEANVSPQGESPPSPPRPNPFTDTIKQSIDKGEFIEAKDGAIYGENKGIVIDKTFLVAMESYRVNYNYTSSYNPNKYLVITDFMIQNILNTDYRSTLSSFVLTDSRNYTYRPSVLYVGTGDVAGTIASGMSKRGEIVFEVPRYDRIFKLNFNPGEIIKNHSVTFGLNTKPLMPEDIFKYESHE